ncbi:hypothetical protein [Brevundimonas sp.]|uniref:hypothetical protein n=1 Tax=Brevundimonas sp. TaxID=1871086 RepID=UPI002D65B0CC|nr:hypothetical protein [Brevundimonas sp.]HYD26330.1 hypothetical protein [Brevundimonas sp.]
MKLSIAIPAAVAAFGVSACQTLPLPGTNERLQREIAEISGRVEAQENGIEQATAEISATEESIRASVRYRPIIAWAEGFSSGPTDNRTITFRQTSKTGNIDQRRHQCRVPFGPYHDGWEARIHEEDSTRASVLIDRLAVAPLADGLRVSAPLRLDFRTQVEGSYRPACAGWLPSANIGVTGEASPTAIFNLTLAGTEDGSLRYRLALVSPSSIGIEMRAHFPRFRIGFTVPVEGLANALADGEIDLLFDRTGEIRLPDGQVIGYRLNTVDPGVTTDLTGVTFTSGLNVVVGTSGPER